MRIVADNKLTTDDGHPRMRQALDVGQRTVMLHQGGWCWMCRQRARGLDVHHLLDMFEKVRGENSTTTLLLG